MARNISVVGAKKASNSFDTYLQLTATTETSLIAAQGAGLVAGIMSLTIANGNAAASTVTLRRGLAGSTRMIFRMAIGQTETFDLSPLGLWSNANELISVQSSTAGPVDILALWSQAAAA